MWGCGFHGYEGQSETKWACGSKIEPYCRTCPQYYYKMPFVQSVVEDLDDYKRGALGNVRQLGSAYRKYLKMAEAEYSRWEAENKKQIMEMDSCK